MIKSLLYRGTLVLDRVLASVPSIGRFRPPKGHFSAWERLQRGQLEGDVIAPSQPIGPCPPGSITELCGMRQHDHQPWPIFWVRSDDARLVGSMLHWRDAGDQLCGEGVFRMKHRRRLSEDRYLAQILVPEPKDLPGAWTSLASNWADGKNYFHWITDGLTRLMVREQLPEETRILLPAQTPFYVTETLEILGLSHLAQTAPSPCVRPERYYFCSPTAMSGVWNPAGFDWLRRAFAQYTNHANTGDPIFLTRRSGTRVPENIGEIEALFNRNGYEIHDCGGLSVKEQIRIASSAPAIAGFHGAAMTNLLWARPGTPVLELFTPGYLNACYEQISFQASQDYTSLRLEEGNRFEVTSRWIQEWIWNSDPR